MLRFAFALGCRALALFTLSFALSFALTFALLLGALLFAGALLLGLLSLPLSFALFTRRALSLLLLAPVPLLALPGPFLLLLLLRASLLPRAFFLDLPLALQLRRFPRAVDRSQLFGPALEVGLPAFAASRLRGPGTRTLPR